MTRFDALTETVDCVDYLSYKALAKTTAKSKKGSGPDYPTFPQAMSEGKRVGGDHEV
jgi:hypothetical protein